MLALVGALGAAVWVVGWSGVLAVREVRVEVDGADAASAGSVGADLAARVEDAAAVASGTPLARVDADAVEARVDEAVPDIAGVEVRRSWPRTLTIAVTSRVAAAVVPDGDRWWSVDDSGVLFAPSPERPEGLPVVEASAASAAAATRAAGVAVAAGLPADLLALVDAVVAESEADVRLELADGALVMWGTPERGADKAEVLLALIAGRDDPPRRYDVTAPDHPAVRP